MDLHNVDPETRALMVELELNELQALANTTDASTDLGSAVKASREELVRAVQIVGDEQLATAINGDDSESDSDDGDCSDDAVDNTIEGYSISENEDNTESQPEPDAKVCVCCSNLFPPSDLLDCLCSHTYCHACIQTLFEQSFADSSLFPPRCCRIDIPIQAAQGFLTQEAVDKYSAKLIEFSTPNPTYCWNPHCALFITPEKINVDERRALCEKCGRITCVECKANWHGYQGECPIQETLRIAEQAGWQRCPSCRNLIELSHGCYHMTCRCRAEFCYLCAAPWKTCECAQWDEGHLMARAEAIFQIADEPEGEARQRVLDRIRRQLIARHECDHRRWRSLSGRFRCENCWQSMGEFIYECRQCAVMMCRGCRFNRQ